jgi:hydrogenase assembly chaperone HypC/HupF
MCITFPGHVLAIAEGEAMVDVDGRRRRASTLLEPAIEVGDWVLVGAGHVLRRLEPAEATVLTRTLAGARASTDARVRPGTQPRTPGGPR